MQNRPPQPFNALPPVVVAMALLIVAIEALFTLGARGIIGGPGAIGWRNIAIQTYGFNADVLWWMVENRRFPAEQVQRLVTYSFVHGSFTHALLAVVMLLALGKVVAEVLRGVRMVVLFFASAIFGAVVYGLTVGGQQPWLIGAYPGIYGLIGGFTCLLWLRLGQVGAPQSAAFRLIGFLMAIQLLFGILFGGSFDWVADLSAFMLGFFLCFLLIPGGWGHALERLRNRR